MANVSISRVSEILGMKPRHVNARLPDASPEGQKGFSPQQVLPEDVERWPGMGGGISVTPYLESQGRVGDQQTVFFEVAVPCDDLSSSDFLPNDFQQNLDSLIVPDAPILSFAVPLELSMALANEGTSLDSVENVPFLTMPLDDVTASASPLTKLENVSYASISHQIEIDHPMLPSLRADVELFEPLVTQNFEIAKPEDVKAVAAALAGAQTGHDDTRELMQVQKVMMGSDSAEVSVQKMTQAVLSTQNFLDEDQPASDDADVQSLGLKTTVEGLSATMALMRDGAIFPQSRDVKLVSQASMTMENIAMADMSIVEQVESHFSKVNFEKTPERLRIELRPEALGHIEIDFDFLAEGRVAVVVKTEQATTLEFLRRDADTLLRVLQEAGLATTGQDLSFNLQNKPEVFFDLAGDDAVKADLEVSPDSVTVYDRNSSAVSNDRLNILV